MPQVGGGQLLQEHALVCIDGLSQKRGAERVWWVVRSGRSTEHRDADPTRDGGCLPSPMLVPTWLSHLLQDTSLSGPQVLHLSQGGDLPTLPTTQAAVEMQ